MTRHRHGRRPVDLDRYIYGPPTVAERLTFDDVLGWRRARRLAWSAWAALDPAERPPAPWAAVALDWRDRDRPADPAAYRRRAGLGFDAWRPVEPWPDDPWGWER